jgi:AraC-like DNA-binding protein
MHRRSHSQDENRVDRLFRELAVRKPFEHDDQFHCTDLDLAREMVTRLLWPHDLSLIGRYSRLDAWLWSHRLRNIAVSDIAYGADVRIVPGMLESFFVVMIPLAGSSVIRCGHQELQTRSGIASVPAPAERLTMRWSAECAQRILRIEKPTLEAHLSDMLGRHLERPLEFTMSLHLDGGNARIFGEEVLRLVALLDRDRRAFEHPLAVSAVEQTLMTRLLLGAQHNYSDELIAEAAAVPSRMAQDAIELIEAHPEWDHTVGSLSRALGVSRRSLERAFRKHMGISPWRYVKSVRLRRAHDQLRAADPSQVTVGEVARRWGMTHSQFSADHRRTYGEAPWQTLRATTR